MHTITESILMTVTQNSIPLFSAEIGSANFPVSQPVFGINELCRVVEPVHVSLVFCEQLPLCTSHALTVDVDTNPILI